MREFKNLAEDLPAAIRAHLLTILDEDFRSLPFEETLGGNCFIIETCEDLTMIPVGDGNATNTIDVMDNVEQLEEYMLFYAAETDLGGPGFYVPLSIYENSILLKLIKSETERYWNEHAKV